MADTKPSLEYIAGFFDGGDKDAIDLAAARLKRLKMVAYT